MVWGVPAQSSAGALGYGAYCGPVDGFWVESLFYHALVLSHPSRFTFERNKKEIDDNDE